MALFARRGNNLGLLWRAFGGVLGWEPKRGGPFLGKTDIFLASPFQSTEYLGRNVFSHVHCFAVVEELLHAMLLLRVSLTTVICETRGLEIQSMGLTVIGLSEVSQPLIIGLNQLEWFG